ncbi:hypothetical protein HPB51_012453 [Rhipicephalus microplus]|uniref:Uncharacterized protein n=1 Tax=Rhipicephalus microplus TaxID=6941 RepID=A0A9J6E9R6_RHIMP|nr:hypothetical protein HPB51_012453 [Rhipicephalus microplus]
MSLPVLSESDLAPYLDNCGDMFPVSPDDIADVNVFWNDLLELELQPQTPRQLSDCSDPPCLLTPPPSDPPSELQTSDSPSKQLSQSSDSLSEPQRLLSQPLSECPRATNAVFSTSHSKTPTPRLDSVATTRDGCSHHGSHVAHLRTLAHTAGKPELFSYVRFVFCLSLNTIVVACIPRFAVSFDA